MINGKTLIDLGYTPGKWFAEAIAHINEKNLTGINRVLYLETMKPLPEIEPFPNPVFYHKNISSNSEQDSENIAKVIATMDEVMKTPTVITGAIMPDACPAGPFGHIPVGGVVVTRNAIHPAMHSADVCCSMMLTAYHSKSVTPAQLMDAGFKTTHFGPSARKKFFDLPEELEAKFRKNPFLNSSKSLKLAKEHLGTQGDGNHFFYVGITTSTGGDYPSIVTHHGSRGVGALLYKHGMVVAERFRKEISPKTNPLNAWIPADSQEGIDYWEALQIVREWTKLNHELIHYHTAINAGIAEVEVRHISKHNLWNEHNFVFKRGNLFYHAKGATPMVDDFVPDNPTGFRLIPLNMAEPILIVSHLLRDHGLGFAPHGAGRNISRSHHMRNLGGRTVEEVLAEETKGLDIRFFTGNPDVSELPSAYKNAEWLKDQIKQFDLGMVISQINPYGSIMAGHTVYSKRSKR